MYRRHSYIDNGTLCISRWLAHYIWSTVERELRKINRASEKIGKDGSETVTEALKYCADELMTLHIYTCQGEEKHDEVCKKIRGEIPGH